jgi:NAD+ kinase
VTIGVIVNETKDIGLTTARKLVGAIRAHGGAPLLSTGLERVPGFVCPPDLRDVFTEDRALLTRCGALICIGGDGTLIKAAREAKSPSGAPFLGVNLGTLGYLTEVEISEIDMILDRVFNREYRIEERMMLSVTRARGGRKSHPEEIVLNELAIGRGGAPHVIKLKLFLNDTFLDIFPGDGILVSTPTGSTAYSLSAGGPVIDPELDAISIVPICPHVIFSRPILVAPDKEIRIVPVAAGGTFSASVSVDGYTAPELCEDEVLTVRRSRYVTKMLRFNADNFYVVLKNKLFDTSKMLGGGAP